MDAVTDPNILAQLNAPDVSPPVSSSGSLQPVTDQATLNALGGNDTPATGAEVRSYDPSWRDKLALGIGHMLDAVGVDTQSPEAQRIISGIAGSTGLGHDGMGIVDLTPAHVALSGQEAVRDVQAGAPKQAALDTLAALPAPVVGKAVDAGASIAGNVIDRVANMAPGATGPIADAADQLGVKIPTVASYPSNGIGGNVQNVAGKMVTIPFVGDPLKDATKTALDDLESAADATTKQYLQQPNGPVPSLDAAAPAPVGDTVKKVLSDWIGGKGPTNSPAILNGLYKGVDALIPQNASAPLPETTKVVQSLLAKDDASGTEVSKSAIDFVAGAISRPQGLTYSGMKDLRTAVGAKLDDALLPDAGTVKPALKQIYGGLTKDLDATVAGLGGHHASAAWDHAETVANDFAQRREDLTKIIGSDGAMNSEGVVDRLVRYAGSQSTADIQKLALAQRTLGPAWDDVSAAAIQRLGRNQANEFDLGQFTKHYEALSNNGRNILFASTGKQALKDNLDALSTLGTRFKLMQSYLNHSNTGGTVALGSAIGMIAAQGLHGLGVVLTAGLGGRAVSKWLARPANLKQVTAFGQNVANAVKSNNGAQQAKTALSYLARYIAADTGQDPASVQSRMMAVGGGVGQ